MLSAFDRQTELGLYAFISGVMLHLPSSLLIIWIMYPYLVDSFHEKPDG